MNSRNRTLSYWFLCCWLLGLAIILTAKAAETNVPDYDIFIAKLMIIDKTNNEVKAFDLDIQDTLYQRQILENTSGYCTIPINNSAQLARVEQAECRCLGTGNSGYLYPLKLLQVTFTLQSEQLHQWDGHALDIQGEDISVPNAEPLTFQAKPRGSAQNNFFQIVKFSGEETVYLKEPSKTITRLNLQVNVPETWFAFTPNKEKRQGLLDWAWPTINHNSKPVHLYTIHSKSPILTTHITPRYPSKNECHWGAPSIPDIFSFFLITYLPESRSFEAAYRMIDNPEVQANAIVHADKGLLALCILLEEKVQPAINEGANQQPIDQYRGYRAMLTKEDLTPGFHTVRVSRISDQDISKKGWLYNRSLGYDEFLSLLDNQHQHFRACIRLRDNSWGAKVSASRYYIKPATPSFILQKKIQAVLSSSPGYGDESNDSTAPFNLSYSTTANAEKEIAQLQLQIDQLQANIADSQQQQQKEKKALQQDAALQKERLVKLEEQALTTKEQMHESKLQNEALKAKLETASSHAEEEQQKIHERTQQAERLRSQQATHQLETVFAPPLKTHRPDVRPTNSGRKQPEPEPMPNHTILQDYMDQEHPSMLPEVDYQLQAEVIAKFEQEKQLQQQQTRQSRRYKAGSSLITRQERRDTFPAGWTSPFPHINPVSLARAGFAYVGPGDKVACVHPDCPCSIHKPKTGLKNWEEGEYPFGEHLRHCEQCPLSYNESERIKYNIIVEIPINGKLQAQES